MRQHFGNTSSPALHNAIQKYGRDAFTLEILHEVLDIFLDDLETAEIKRHNTIVPHGYNLDGGGNANKVVSDQTRKKLSAAHKGRTLSPEHRKNISAATKGKKVVSDQTRKKMSDANKGKTHTPETRQKISNIKKGSTHTPEARQKISVSSALPERDKAFKILDSLPKDMPLKERRKHLRNEFPERGRARIYQWSRQWLKTSSPNTPSDRPKAYDAPEAYEILNSLPSTISLAERRKILRDKFPDRHRTAIYLWVKQWSETSP